MNQPTETRHYRAIVIGAGQSGVPLSRTLAESGWKTALVEKIHVGGTCINEGCTPTKTMVASARVAYLASRAADYGVHTGPVSVDLAKVRERKRRIVESFREGGRRRIENTEGLDFYTGEAEFTGPKSLRVRLNQGGELRLSADHIFINTGARPSVPDLEGLDGVPYLDSTTIMELGDVPEHLLIVGGGYVGLEFAQMFRRFGSQVSIVQRGSQLLTREDRDVADEVAEILRQDGVQIFMDAEAQRVFQDGEARIHLLIDSPGGRQELVGSNLLIAAGRVPQTRRLNLEAAGIETDGRGHIQANERLETSVPGVYALGDVKGGPAFTHISYDDYRILRDNLLRGGSRTTTDRPVPYVVFIDPQLGRVGLTEEQARKQGINVKVAKMPMRHVARAIEVDETRGLMKVVIDAGSDRILGAAILGLEGGEIMSIVEVAMLGGLPYTALQEAVFAHPTLAESLNNLFMSMES